LSEIEERQPASSEGFRTRGLQLVRLSVRLQGGAGLFALAKSVCLVHVAVEIGPLLRLRRRSRGAGLGRVVRRCRCFGERRRLGRFSWRRLSSGLGGLWLLRLTRRLGGSGGRGRASRRRGAGPAGGRVVQQQARSVGIPGVPPAAAAAAPRRSTGKPGSSPRRRTPAGERWTGLCWAPPSAPSRLPRSNPTANRCSAAPAQRPAPMLPPANRPSLTFRSEERGWKGSLWGKKNHRTCPRMGTA